MLLVNWVPISSAPYAGITIDGNVTDYSYEITTVVFNFWTISGSNARFSSGLMFWYQILMVTCNPSSR